MGEGKKIEDGGPAFPIPDVVTASEQLWESGAPGMSLRDWFAGQALAGLLAKTVTNCPDAPVAIRAYGLADAMLRARGENQS